MFQYEIANELQIRKNKVGILITNTLDEVGKRKVVKKMLDDEISIAVVEKLYTIVSEILHGL